MRITVDHIEPLMPDLGFGWVTVTARWQDVETTAWPTVTVRVPVAYKCDWSLDQIADAALNLAHHALRAAVIGVGEMDKLQYMQEPIAEIVGDVAP